MRISSAILLCLAAAACGPQGEAADVGAERIACAPRGANAFAEDCTVNRTLSDGTLYLVVRHPDGAFRRFEVLRDGRGLAAADGASEARISTGADMIEVAVEHDRYRFPATIGRGGDRAPSSGSAPDASVR